MKLKMYEVVGFTIILFLLLIIGTLTLEAVTMKSVGTKMVRCIDKLGNPFQDELCEEGIYCTKFGIYYDKCQSKSTMINQEEK